MKIHHFALFFLPLLATCSRHSGNPAAPPTGLQAEITGKWTIDHVTSFFFDSTGALRPNGIQVYVAPPGYYYQFNSNHTWTEVLADTLSIDGMSGTYSINGDSSFTLVNPAAPTPEPCKVDTLTASLFVFHHERATHYNGVTPGYIRYLFHMVRGN